MTGVLVILFAAAVMVGLLSYDDGEDDRYDE